MSEAWICVTCGVQYAPGPQPPDHCLVCEDERQFVGWDGQAWTTLRDLRGEHQNAVTRHDSGIHTIATEPLFGIGQHAYRVEGECGAVMWDCTALCDGGIGKIDELGGIFAIAISHPHFYSTMVEWAIALDVPIYLHHDDRQWIMRPDPHIVLWDGETHTLCEDLTLIRCGGHFEGGTVLHRAPGIEAPGALFPGDIIQVVPDRRWVSFMRSYPNLIPLGSRTIRRIVDAVDDLEFDVLYGPWPGRIVRPQALEVVRKSALRYLAAIAD